jgi:hypothetical protein
MVAWVAAMTMMTRKSKTLLTVRPAVLLALVCTTLFVGACGITAPRSNDGFADLESLGMRDTDRVMNISIGPTLLHFTAGFLDDEPEIRELLRGLDGVRVRIYEIDGDASRVAQRISTMSEHLQVDGWAPVMLVREEDEEVHMLMRVVEGQICGMTVLVSDGDSEAVIVNLMGEIRPQQFSDVMVALEVDAPGIHDVQVAEQSEG